MDIKGLVVAIGILIAFNSMESVGQESSQGWVAPGALVDLWADPRGEFLSCTHANPVYRLLGVKGLEAKHMPPLDSPIHSGRFGYHIRTGRHDLTENDWQRYMDFSDKHWKGK